jgi:hypothetical protein
VIGRDGVADDDERARIHEVGGGWNSALTPSKNGGSRT